MPCNPFNPRYLIYHLTNRRPRWYSLIKVLLTVSPNLSLLPAATDLFPPAPQAVSPLSTAFTPNGSLNPLSTAFTQNIPGGGPFNFCFPALRPTGRCVSAASPLLSLDCGLLFSLIAFFRIGFLCFQELAASFAKTPGYGCLSDSSAFSLPIAGGR